MHYGIFAMKSNELNYYYAPLPGYSILIARRGQYGCWSNWQLSRGALIHSLIAGRNSRPIAIEYCGLNYIPDFLELDRHLQLIDCPRSIARLRTRSLKPVASESVALPIADQLRQSSEMA
jgi:hypothetical protein